MTIGCDLTGAGLRASWVDNAHGELVSALLTIFEQQGARRVGVILASPEYSYTIAVREAYLTWAEARGQPPMLVEIDSHPSERAGYDAAKLMLASASPPDAIFASLDRLAAGVLLAAQHRGIDVPGQLMIAAGTDGVESRNAVVPITALDLQPEKLGRTAVSQLIAKLEGSTDLSSVTVEGNVLRRASTARKNP